MVVAYDGTDFSRLRRTAQPAARADGRRRAGRARSARCCGIDGRPRLRGPHRRGRARVGPGRVASPREPGLDPWKLAAGGQRRCSARRSSCGRASSSTPDSTRGTRRVWRKYRYTIVNRPVPDPFRDRFTWWVPEPLDLRVRCGWPPTRSSASTTSRRSAARAARARRRCARVQESSLGRRRRRRAALRDPRASRSAGRWCAPSSARSSRSASGKRRPGEMLGLIAARDRAVAGQLAPPRGLCLWDVGY